MFQKIEGVVDRISFGLLLLIPACLIMMCVIVLGGPYLGTGMVIGSVILGSAWVLGDLLIAMIGKD